MMIDDFIDELIQGAATRPGKVRAMFDVVLGGRRYRAEAMEQVASYEFGRSPDDFSYTEEALYRSAKGAFLLVVEGWLHHSGDGTSYGHAYAPLDRSQAMAWLEFRGRHEALTELFGDEVEDA
ncbi:hypothetical protein [Azospirillum argentinense]|uniref:Uncharacterized protein n=1 Tax=Azospirillum argentinense TaxID=2970906 RepID=A0A5B0KKG0_9PROT|nr:hypothetical protein [Azospirillum argentinense]KAA1053147.1 hypothetical protein FH063_003066 [Azospirillum argentinense]